MVKQRHGVVNRQLTDIRNRVVIDCYSQDFGFESLALAGVARPFLHEAFDVAADKIAFGFAVAALQVGNNPFIGGFKRAAQPQADPKMFTAGTIKNLIKLLFAQLTSRHVQTEMVGVSHGL